MKTVFFTLLLGAMCASLALAQDAATTGQSMSPTGSSKSASPIQGCLSGSDGSYTLTQDGTGTTYKLMGDETQVKKHVGHEVAVTGETSGSAGTASASDQGQTPSSASSVGDNAIQVTSVKMISKQCNSAGTNPPQSQ